MPVMLNIMNRLKSPTVTLEQLDELESIIIMEIVKLPGSMTVEARLMECLGGGQSTKGEMMDMTRHAMGEPISEIFYVEQYQKNLISDVVSEYKFDAMKVLINPEIREEIKKQKELAQFSESINRKAEQGQGGQLTKFQKDYNIKILRMIFDSRQEQDNDMKDRRELQLKLNRVKSLYRPTGAARSQLAAMTYDSSQGKRFTVEKNAMMQREIREKLLSNFRKMLLKKRAELIKRKDEVKQPRFVSITKQRNMTSSNESCEQEEESEREADNQIFVTQASETKKQTKFPTLAGKVTKTEPGNHKLYRRDKGPLRKRKHGINPIIIDTKESVKIDSEESSQVSLAAPDMPLVDKKSILEGGADNTANRLQSKLHSLLMSDVKPQDQSFTTSNKASEYQASRTDSSKIDVLMMSIINNTVDEVKNSVNMDDAKHGRSKSTHHGRSYFSSEISGEGSQSKHIDSILHPSTYSRVQQIDHMVMQSYEVRQSKAELYKKLDEANKTTADDYNAITYDPRDDELNIYNLENSVVNKKKFTAGIEGYKKYLKSRNKYNREQKADFAPKPISQYTKNMQNKEIRYKLDSNIKKLKTIEASLNNVITLNK